MKLSMLEHRVQLVETENLRLRQDALRSEQLKLSETQINLERRQSPLLASSMMDSANYMNQRNSQWQSVMQNGQFSSGNMGVRQQAYPGQIPMQQNLWTNQVLGYASHPHFLGTNPTQNYGIQSQQPSGHIWSRVGANHVRMQQPCPVVIRPVNSWNVPMSAGVRGVTPRTDAAHGSLDRPISAVDTTVVTDRAISPVQSRPTVQDVSDDVECVISSIRSQPNVQEDSDVTYCDNSQTQSKPDDQGDSVATDRAFSSVPSKPKSTNIDVVPSSSPVRHDLHVSFSACESGEPDCSVLDSSAGVGGDVSPEEHCDKEAGMIQMRETGSYHDDRARKGVQQSFLGQATVPTKPPWRTTPMSTFPVNLSLGTSAPAIISMTQQYPYPQMRYPVNVVPQQGWLPLMSRTFTPTNFTFPH